MCKGKCAACTGCITRASGFEAWRGLSRVDGKTPVVLIVCTRDSANRKTGAATVQTMILSQNVHPCTALTSGRDVAVCGTCPHRSKASGGLGTCYVCVAQGPTSAWKSWKNGHKPRANVFAAPGTQDREAWARLLRGRTLRCGTYGDPAAVPWDVWEALASEAGRTVGYTHGWRYTDQRLAAVCMASCDNAADRADAKAAGWRTFSVRLPGQSCGPRESVCPAETRPGLAKCETCGRCGGLATPGWDVVITVHGHGVSKWTAAQAAAPANP